MWLPCERHDECASMVPPPEVTERLDARIANVARFAQWPLNLLASFAFIDGAWLGEFGAWSKLAGAQPATGNVLASVGSDVVNVASSLSESAARLASDMFAHRMESDEKPVVFSSWGPYTQVSGTAAGTAVPGITTQRAPSTTKKPPEAAKKEAVSQ